MVWPRVETNLIQVVLFRHNLPEPTQNKLIWGEFPQKCKIVCIGVLSCRFAKWQARYASRARVFWMVGVGQSNENLSRQENRKRPRRERHTFPHLILWWGKSNDAYSKRTLNEECFFFLFQWRLEIERKIDMYMYYDVFSSLACLALTHRAQCTCTAPTKLSTWTWFSTMRSIQRSAPTLRSMQYPAPTLTAASTHKLYHVMNVHVFHYYGIHCMVSLRDTHALA